MLVLWFIFNLWMNWLIPCRCNNNNECINTELRQRWTVKVSPSCVKFWGSREENCQKYSPSLSLSHSLSLCSRGDIPARLQGSTEQPGWEKTRLGDVVLLCWLHCQTFLLPRPDRDREEEVSRHLLIIFSYPPPSSRWLAALEYSIDRWMRLS